MFLWLKSALNLPTPSASSNKNVLFDPSSKLTFFIADRLVFSSFRFLFI